MGDMRESFDALRAYTKEQHDARVAKTPERLAYAIKQLEAHGIEYTVKNPQSGHIHCRRKSDDALFQFWAGTGKIMGYPNIRGIHNLVGLLDDVRG